MLNKVLTGKIVKLIIARPIPSLILSSMYPRIACIIFLTFEVNSFSPTS